MSVCLPPENMFFTRGEVWPFSFRCVCECVCVFVQVPDSSCDIAVAACLLTGKDRPTPSLFSGKTALESEPQCERHCLFVQSAKCISLASTPFWRRNKSHFPKAGVETDTQTYTNRNKHTHSSISLSLWNDSYLPLFSVHPFKSRVLLSAEIIQFWRERARETTNRKGLREGVNSSPEMCLTVCLTFSSDGSETARNSI